MGLSPENIERIASLCAGAAWFGLAGGGPEALVLMGAASGGLAATASALVRRDLFKKSPDSKKAVVRICKQFEKDFESLPKFPMSDADIEAMDDIIPVLPDLVFDNWPSMQRIAELATDVEGFPDAVATDVLNRIADQAETFGHLRPVAFGGNERAREHTLTILRLLMLGAVSEKETFDKMAPQLIFRQLECAGALQISIDALTGDGTLTLASVLREVKQHVTADGEKTREKVDDVREILMRLAYSVEAKTGDTISIDPQSAEAFEKAIASLSQAKEGAKKRALERVSSVPPDVGGAVSELKQLAAHGEENVAELAQTYRDIGGIAFLTETWESIDAWKRVTELEPDDAEAHNQLGHLYDRTGDLERARAAYEKVLSLGNVSADKTLIAVAYGNLGLIEQTRGNLDAAETYLKNSLALNEELGRKEGMAKQYGNLGLIEQTRGNLDAAETYLTDGLKIDEELGRKEGMAAKHGNLGLIEKTRGNLDAAEAYHKKSLALNEELGRKEGMAIQYGNLGLIEETRGNLDAAETYFKDGLKIDEELGRKEGMAAKYGNLGLIEQTRGNLDAAEAYHKKSLALNEELGRKEGMAQQYGNLGLIEQTRGDLDAAEAYHKKSLAIEEELGRKEGMASDFCNLGVIETMRGNLDAAEAYLRKSLALNEELGRKEGMAQQYGNLGLIEQTRGDLDAAEAYHKKSLAIEEELGRKEGMASDFCNLGVIETMRGNLNGALDYWRRSLSLYQQIGMPHMIEKIQGWIDGAEAQKE